MGTNVLDELLVGLGFDYEPEEVEQFKKDIGETTELIGDLIKTAAAGAAAILGLSVATTAATDSQGKLADEIGETVGTIDALQFATRIAGGTADGMATSLRNLAIRAGDASRGVGSGVEAFGILGISTTKTNGKLKLASELMFEVSQRFQGLDKFRQIELADKLGLSESIRLLQLGPPAISELIARAKELGTTTREDAILSADFQDSLVDLWQITKQISRTLTREFVPVLQKGNEFLREWWKANRELIELKLPEWLETITTLMKGLTVAVSVFLGFRLVAQIGTLILAFKGLSISILATNAALFLLPGLIGAAIILFGALVEDAKVFFAGGESFIGDMLEKFPQWETEIRGIAKAFNNIAELTNLIFEGWANIFKLFETGVSLDGFKDTLKSLPGFVLDTLKIGTGPTTGDGAGALALPAKNPLLDLLSTAALGPLKLALPILDDVNSSLPGAKSRFGNVGLPPTVNNKSTSSTTRIDKLEIVVNGSDKSESAIAQEVLSLFEQTARDLNSVVDQ